MDVIGRRMDLGQLAPGLMRQRDLGGAGHDQMRLDPAALQDLQQANTVDYAEAPEMPTTRRLGTATASARARGGDLDLNLGALGGDLADQHRVGRAYVAEHLAQPGGIGDIDPAGHGIG